MGDGNRDVPISEQGRDLMSCYRPIQAYQHVETRAVIFANRGDVRPITLPCRRCVGCCLDYSRTWAIRCVHESKLHRDNSFITLTYSDEYVRYSLNYVDFQLFCKRMRKRLGPFRFYMCGEYGEKFLRPHFHACIFGIDFDDKVVFTKSGDSTLYTSKILSELWPYGFCSIGEMNDRTAAYVAGYVMKKATRIRKPSDNERVIAETGEIVEVTPEFTRMSLKPGIGYGFYEKFKSDIFPRDYIVIDGRKMGVPRYYRNKLKFDDVQMASDLEYDRFVAITDDMVYNNGAERLEVREKVALAKLKKRSLE